MKNKILAIALTVTTLALVFLCSPVSSTGTTSNTTDNQTGYGYCYMSAAPRCPYDIAHVKAELDYARRSHQKVLDDPTIGAKWQTTSEKLQWNYRWVTVYEEAIDILNWMEVNLQ